MAKKVNSAIQYANDVVNKKNKAPKYVIKQCEEFLEIVENKSEKYYLEIKKKEQQKQIQSN